MARSELILRPVIDPKGCIAPTKAPAKSKGRTRTLLQVVAGACAREFWSVEFGRDGMLPGPTGRSKSGTMSYA